MSTVLRNIHDMAVPDFAFTDNYDGRVFVIDVDAHGKAHKHNIGQMTDPLSVPKRMVPNTYFRSKYEDLFREAYPDVLIPSHELGIGMYGLTLKISKKIELYSALQDVYGPQYANYIMDYAMYSIIYQSNVTQAFETSMSRMVLFSDKLHSDTWYSRFFANDITEDKHHLLRIKRVEYLVKNGLKKVWIAIDGSNNDCVARQSFLAKYGFPKSHNKNKTIVGYMYAVDAETGRPITYTVYDGSVPDCQAFQKMAVFLKSFQIEIEGVILDRGFAVEEVFRTIADFNWKYVIMLPTDVYGHTQMIDRHGEEIRWKSGYIIGDGSFFGISDNMKLFANQDRTSNICLFFNGMNGSAQSVRLSKKIVAEKKRIEKAIAGGNRATVDKGLHKYMAIAGEGTNRQVVIYNDKWDDSMSTKGFSSMAVSEGITPEMANLIYKMRDTSEKMYSTLKSQEGCEATRVHKTEGIYSKFMLSFVSSVIRFEIEDICQKLNLDTNPTIQGLDQIILLYTAENTYDAVRNLTTQQKALFAELDMNQDDFEHLARVYNQRKTQSAKNPVRKLPDKTVQLIKKNSGKPGRHSKSDEKSEMTTSPSTDLKVKSKGGRPKGSVDKIPRKPRSDKGKKRGKYTTN